MELARHVKAATALAASASASPGGGPPVANFPGVSLSYSTGGTL